MFVFWGYDKLRGKIEEDVWGLKPKLAPNILAAKMTDTLIQHGHGVRAQKLDIFFSLRIVCE